MEKLTKLSYQEIGQSFDTVVEEVMDTVKEKTRIVLLKLKERIENDEFGMVLGVDGSGRIPALLLGQTMRYAVRTEIKFVAGSRYVVENRGQRILELRKYFQRSEFKGLLNGRKVIVCDDVIVSGESIKLICVALQLSDIPYEVVSLSIQRGEFSADELEQNVGSNIIYSDTNIPLSYNKPQMSGVKKSSEIFSEPLDKYFADDNNNLGGVNNDESKQKPEILRRTRELIKQHASELAEELNWI